MTIYRIVALAFCFIFISISPTRKIKTILRQFKVGIGYTGDRKDETPARDSKATQRSVAARSLHPCSLEGPREASVPGT